jgi:hypothetical protein
VLGEQATLSVDKLSLGGLETPLVCDPLAVQTYIFASKGNDSYMDLLDKAGA